MAFIGKKIDKVDPNKELEARIFAIYNEHKDFGYRRMQAMLRKGGIYKQKESLANYAKTWNTSNIIYL